MYMSHNGVLDRVIEILSTLTEATEITADSELMDDLEVSSMDVLMLITTLEAEFNIEIPEKAIRSVVTVGDIADVVNRVIA